MRSFSIDHPFNFPSITSTNSFELVLQGIAVKTEPIRNHFRITKSSCFLFFVPISTHQDSTFFWIKLSSYTGSMSSSYFVFIDRKRRDRFASPRALSRKHQDTTFFVKYLHLLPPFKMWPIPLKVNVPFFMMTPCCKIMPDRVKGALCGYSCIDSLDFCLPELIATIFDFCVCTFSC